MCKQTQGFAAFWESQPSRDTELAEAADFLRPFVTDAESRLRAAIREGKRVLLEGAQGTMLDLDHGTYPYVTSSSTTTGGALASLGLGPKSVTRLLGVAKAYVTRVGAGPMPTELHDAFGDHLAKVGAEFGATTGRKRRCGWLDAVALRYAAAINGFDGLILNKIDVMTGLPEVKICVAYKHPTLGTLNELPWDQSVLAECEPVYETFPGWNEPLRSGGRLSDLPASCRRYIEAIERVTGIPVVMIGTGVGREDLVTGATGGI
jgi:adenylosuccinate synthase